MDCVYEKKKKQREREYKEGDNKDAACPNENSRVLPSTVIVAGFSLLLLDVSFYSRTRHALTLLLLLLFFFLSFFHRVYAFLFRRCCCYCCFASI